jgi:hypothetical protein
LNCGSKGRIAVKEKKGQDIVGTKIESKAITYHAGWVINYLNPPFSEGLLRTNLS